MTPADVPNVLDVQQPGAVVGLAEVFPQDAYPFPREVVGQRWLEEIVTPDVDCLVLLHDNDIVGFAAVRADELKHFGVALEQWGTGIAREGHDAVLERMRARGVRRAWLRVFADNKRGRRFYEKLGWRHTGEHSRSGLPPYPVLLHYERDLIHGHAS
jgi:RimJ/RimL family protein N-acetyltransferase